MSFRHWLIRKRQRRDQSHYTHFLRLPTQFEALAGPVLDFLGPAREDSTASELLRIAVVGCSIGAEVYTIASTLKNRLPALDFRIDASDIEPAVLEKAQAGRYTQDEVYSHDLIHEAFIQETFDAENGAYTIRKSLAECVSFKVADIFSPDLTKIVPPADIVFAQNFLFHMHPAKAHEAFDSIARLLKPRSAFFIDGIDLPVRMAATRRNRLEPLDYKIEQIHNENLRLGGWPWNYWGLEPLSKQKRDWKRRYATIFLRGKEN
jgi:chemotaxis methyl-accepting protein methylase